jgi:2-keto-4-pentenoate hydratase/2-oxohepta-3-ene-1,7-dioic acid hydratase in catechol pathway
MMGKLAGPVGVAVPPFRLRPAKPDAWSALMEQAKLVRYRLGHDVAYGLVRDQTVHHLASDLWAQPRIGPAVASLEEVELLAPCEPTKVIAIGRNYAAHAAEHGAEVPAEPLFFLEPPSAVIGPGATILYPEHLTQRVEHEAELAVVIGRQARQVQREQAPAYIWGYTCANDITARDLQRRDGQWARGKGFDTFCPLGPWIVPDLDTGDLRIRCRVNGELRQDGRTRDMIFSISELIAYVSAAMTLDPGDVILTGTPAGVGPLQPGDRVAVEIEGVGTLENGVARRG